MPKVGIACGASDFRTLHAMRLVNNAMDSRRGYFTVKRRPTTTGTKLHLGFKQQFVATNAEVIANFIGVPKLTREGTLCTRFLRDMELNRCKAVL